MIIGKSEFTGLTDKKGVEIFEGDIVKVEYGIGRVVFNAGCFMIAWIDDPEANMELLGILIKPISGRPRKELEILGNIFEHKNLLENG